MTATSWIKLHCVHEFFKEESKLLKRGENAYDSGHVKKCVFLNNDLKGVIKASMREQTYNVQVILKLTFKLVRTMSQITISY